MSRKEEIIINDDSWLEVSNLAEGVFSPLSGFMTNNEYRSVVDKCELTTGETWPIPITLDVPNEQLDAVRKSELVCLINSKGLHVASLEVEDVYKVDLDQDIRKVFGTTDANHPGVQKEIKRYPYRIGGRVTLKEKISSSFPELTYTPKETKKLFSDRSWQTVVGFQTRNPIHRAHEYLQRVAMEISDGVFIQPLLGWKKVGDFTPAAVIAAYKKMFEEFYPRTSALLGVLMTPMRYAGPREALFHALVRRNYGCTHFIVGRDHAGVGNYYGKYEAHQFCKQFKNIGIEILYLCGPYYSKKTKGIVTEKTSIQNKNDIFEISGTEVRKMLSQGVRPPDEYMRPEISNTLIELGIKKELFIV